MKTNLLTLAATLLLAASANTASATYYLIGDFNSWNEDTKVAFDGNTKTIDNFSGGKFKIMEDGTWLGADNSSVYWLTTNNKSVTLVNKQQGNEADAVDLYLPIASNYTFTITEENGKKTLTVSDLDDLLITCNLINNWAPQRMTKQSDGSYIFYLNDALVNNDTHLQFKILDFNNALWGAASNTATHEIKRDWHTDITLDASEGAKNFEIVEPWYNHRILVKDGKLSLLGYSLDFDNEWEYGFNDYNNQVWDVNLSRTFYCDENWNTICLPFDITDIQNTIFKDATIAYLNSSSLSGGTLTLSFSYLAAGESMVAGTPYLVKWDSKDNISSTTFNGVTINSNASTVTSTDIVNFIGCFKPATISGETYLYLGEESTLYYPSSEITIGTFSAYFELAEGYNAGISAQHIKSFVLNFGDDNEETSIKQINNAASATDTYFTLDGRRLNDKPATPGLYIINGKKVVIK